jgi:hypothetical protein
MSFQDNSGDIIFDIVLTDEGRRRLARGDGSFSIVQFALGDDEINYELYDANASAAQQDLEILQTPVLEAFTNNIASCRSKLVINPRNDLLYLPVIKLNDTVEDLTKLHQTLNQFVVAVDSATEDSNKSTVATTHVAFNSSGLLVQGFLLGFSTDGKGGFIRVDAGIDNSAVPIGSAIPDRNESQYMIEIDNRLGRIISIDGLTRASAGGRIDDDNVATYIFSQNRDTKFVKNNTSTALVGQVIDGARSTYLEFKIESSLDLRQSNFLFQKFGGLATMANAAGATPANNVRFIDSIVKVTGMNSGYSVNIPVRFVKLA